MSKTLVVICLPVHFCTYSLVVQLVKSPWSDEICLKTCYNFKYYSLLFGWRNQKIFDCDPFYPNVTAKTKLLFVKNSVEELIKA